MAYNRKCTRCGAMLDPGEVCRCDVDDGARMQAVRTVPETIEVQSSRQAMMYAADRIIYDAYLSRAEERRARREKRRKR